MKFEEAVMRVGKKRPHLSAVPAQVILATHDTGEYRQAWVDSAWQVWKESHTVHGVECPAPLIEKGMYVKTENIKDTEQWKQVIDAFVRAGFNEYQGYSDNADDYYGNSWRGCRYLGIDAAGDIVHYLRLHHYATICTEISIDDLLNLNKPTPRKHAELACKYFLDDTVEVETQDSLGQWSKMEFNPSFSGGLEYREYKSPKSDNTQEIAKLKEELTTIAARLKELGG